MFRHAGIIVVLCLAATLAWGQDLSGTTDATGSAGTFNYPASQPWGGPLGAALTPITPTLQAPAAGAAPTLGQGWTTPSDGGFGGLSPVAAGFVSGAFSGLTPAPSGGFGAWTPSGGSWLSTPTSAVDSGWATAGQLFASPWAAPLSGSAVPAASTGGWTAIAPEQSLTPNSMWATPQASLLSDTQPLQLQSPSGFSAPATQWGGTWLSPPSAFGGNVTPAWAPAQTPGANPWVQTMPSASLTTNPWTAVVPGGLNVAPMQGAAASPQPALTNPWTPITTVPGAPLPATTGSPAAPAATMEQPAAASPWAPTLVTPGGLAPAAAPAAITTGAESAAANPWSATLAAPTPTAPSTTTATGQPAISSPWSPTLVSPGSLAPNPLAPATGGAGAPAAEGTPTTAAPVSPWVTPWAPTPALSPQVQTGGSWLSNTVAPQVAPTTTPSTNPFLPAAKAIATPNYTPYSPFTGQPAAEPPAGR